MRRHGERRRRLLWAALLLGLVVILAVLSIVDGGLRIFDRLVSVTRDQRAKPKPLRTARGLRRRQELA